MRFSYNGTRHSEKSGCLIHVFYVPHEQAKDFRLRLAFMSEAIAWLDDRQPGCDMRGSRFALHIPDHDTAMEFRLRWC